MLFPPPGVRIRRTIETFALPKTPTLIGGHDPRRVLLSVLPDSYSGLHVSLAGSEIGLSTPSNMYGGASIPIEFWGQEEVWAQLQATSTSDSVNILVQSVFYD